LRELWKQVSVTQKKQTQEENSENHELKKKDTHSEVILELIKALQCQANSYIILHTVHKILQY